MKTIVFSDLDGTLIDEHYSFEKTKPAIDKLLALDIPIVFCSSKTRTEIEFYRKKLGVNDPFISENGAAIFIPKNYFEKNCNCDPHLQEYDVIELGIPYAVLRQKFEAIRKKICVEMIGFGDLTVEEVAKDSELPLELAELAKHREYDEPFRLIKGQEEQLFDAVKTEGLCAAKGDRYWHLSGNHNKGNAVKLLIEQYANFFGPIRTIGVGNGPNDLPMLAVVDTPILVEKKELLDAVWHNVVTCATDPTFASDKR